MKTIRSSQYIEKRSKEKFPEWYQRVVVEGINEEQMEYKVKDEYRCFYLMCTAIYAVKCYISKNEVQEDMYKIYEELKEIENSNPLEKDIKSALKTYVYQYCNFTTEDIIKLTRIPIDKNKLNYQNQNNHLQIARELKISRTTVYKYSK